MPDSVKRVRCKMGDDRPFPSPRHTPLNPIKLPQPIKPPSEKPSPSSLPLRGVENKKPALTVFRPPLSPLKSSRQTQARPFRNEFTPMAVITNLEPFKVSPTQTTTAGVGSTPTPLPTTPRLTSSRPVPRPSPIVGHVNGAGG
ncbi:uncharacterized protein LOC129618168 [Condylostylus longicornis]|uniref:uncharacterized protein LOC129618168 n=1 Tax=Condylostylus longicornis TaxID=2530218 RepID=UPI00244E04FE|nr:uncharacterized protein LOC129618168 [Condylostylus longicornis]